QRLASAGAWAAVFLGLVAFVLARFVADRAETHVIDPILDTYFVLHSVNQGEPYRRCIGSKASSEIRTIRQHINELLDEREDRSAEPSLLSRTQEASGDAS